MGGCIVSIWDLHLLVAHSKHTHLHIYIQLEQQQILILPKKHCNVDIRKILHTLHNHTVEVIHSTTSKCFRNVTRMSNEQHLHVVLHVYVNVIETDEQHS